MSRNRNRNERYNNPKDPKDLQCYNVIRRIMKIYPLNSIYFY
jgi:hypothetical protein